MRGGSIGGLPGHRQHQTLPEAIREYPNRHPKAIFRVHRATTDAGRKRLATSLTTTAGQTHDRILTKDDVAFDVHRGWRAGPDVEARLVYVVRLGNLKSADIASGVIIHPNHPKKGS